MEDVTQLVIIGTGLLGTSIGLGLKASGYSGTIVGVGRQQATVDEARQRGGIDRATTDLAEAVAGAQLAIVAVPLGGFDAVFKQLAAHDHANLTITDVGSTKSDVLTSARRRLPAPQRFLGSHPMAGSEQQGPAGARADLFHGKPCVLTPEPDTCATTVRRVEGLWTRLGMSLLRMSAATHDQQTAVISHLPHAASVLLVQVASELGGWEIASTGFRDTTRLASSNPPMRADILTANRDRVLEAIAVYQKQLDQLSEMLRNNDRPALLALLESSQQLREAWLKARQCAEEAEPGKG